MAHDTVKKRKRDAAAGGDSSAKKKKVSIKEASQKASKAPKTIRVTSVLQPQFSAPVIATTPGLVVPETLQFDCYTRKPKTPKRNRPSAPAEEMLLRSSSHHTVDYTAKEDKTQGTGSALRHYVGIFDPATGDLQVVEAKKMVVRGTVRARQAGEEDMHGVATTKTMTDLRNDLGQTFGTKKAKKAILDLTENAISNRKRNEDGSYDAVPLTASDRALMEEMKAATSSMATREQLQAEVDRAKPIPQGNFAAEEVQDVYDAEQILGADVLAAVPVRDWQETIGKGEGVQVFSQYVANRVAHVAARADGLPRLRLLRYLYWMILYWQQTRPGREKGTRRLPPRAALREAMDGAPEAVIEDLRRRFTDGGTMRKFSADLLMTHCCVFASIVDGFEVSMSDLRDDLRLEQQQMSQYFLEIGARVKVVKKDDTVKHVAKLVLPLQFPDNMRRRRRR